MVATLLETNTNAETQIAAREDLAFFVSKEGLRHNLLGLQREVADSVVDLISSIGEPALRAALKLNLDEALASLEETIETTPGVLWMAFPNKFSIINFSHAEPLIEDYGDGTEASHHELRIPTDKITAVTALPYEYTPNHNEPQVNLRIQTSEDKPHKVYKGPGVVEEVPSLGRWHSFPLGSIALELATSLETVSLPEPMLATS